MPQQTLTLKPHRVPSSLSVPSDAVLYDLGAADDVTIRGDVTATGAITIGQAIEPDGVVSLEAVIQGAGVTADAGGDILLTNAGSINSSDIVDLDAGNLLDIDGTIAGTDLTLRADGDADIATSLNATAGDVEVTAGNDATLTDTVDATGDIDLTAGDLLTVSGELGGNSNAQNISLTSNTGNIDVSAAVDAVAAATFDAGQDLTIVAVDGCVHHRYRRAGHQRERRSEHDGRQHRARRGR